MIYITVEDRFMSGWGLSKDRINILIFECETEDEADIVYENCNARSDFGLVQIYIDIKPFFDERLYYVQDKDKSIYPLFYEEGYFVN